MKTAVFANSKGGVGKSTIALLTSLSLATRHNRSKVELIDLDPQATTSDSLSRFANHRFNVINNEEFSLGSATPNNSNHKKVHSYSTQILFSSQHLSAMRMYLQLKNTSLRLSSYLTRIQKTHQRNHR